MITIGQVVVKIAGRDAGRAGVVIAVDGNRVLVDGQMRRRMVSIDHVEPLSDKVTISENATTDQVRAALQPLGIEWKDTVKKERKAQQKPTKQRKSAKKGAAKKSASKKSKDTAPSE